jgi:hypothetical protein
MKKVIFSLALLLTCSLLAFAQKGISYQAIILDPNPIEIPGQDITGQPFVNGNVSLKYKLFSSTFVQEFEEVHTTQTDAYGMVNVLIGSVSQSAFSGIVWDLNPKSLQVWVSFDQGGTYTKVSEQQLTYNPMALFAETAGKLSGTLAIEGGGTGATTAAAARTNLGLGNVDNTSDANKPVSTATQNALDTKANANEVNTALATKANAAEVTSSLNLKANANEVNTALATKANAAEVTSALATKANAEEVNTALATKANANEVNTALATKANAAEVTSALSTKANASDVSASLALKEDVSNKANTPLGSSTTLYPTQNAVKTYVDEQIASATLPDANSITKGKIQLAGDLGGTAAAPTVPGLALKADAAAVTTSLGLKEDVSNKANTPLGSSTTLYPTQNAVKTYVDAQVAGATIADANGSTKGKIQLAGDLGGTAAAPTVPGLALKLDANQKGVANGVATLNASGIIPSSQLPPVTVSSTTVVGSDAAMTALSNQTVGSIAVRTDVNKNYVLSALPASTLGNWIELLTPAAPVQTVNGYTGSVNLTKTDLGLSEVNNTSDLNKPISTATQNALDLKADGTAVDAALATKLSTADATAALALKATSADVTSALATKLSTADATAALALKANSADVTTALATKISTADATAALALKLDANKVAVANGVASLDALGKVPTDQIPAVSFSSVKVLGSEAEMLGLGSAVVGSVVIRTDINKNYVLAVANPAVRANWIELLTPAPPVQTVNGYSGNVSITKADLGLGNVQNTSDADKVISTQTQTALDTKVDKVTGKGLSTNDYSTAEKTKLAAITGTNTGDQDLSAYATTSALNSKVDKVTGKGLSTNDYTTAEKTKLASINLSSYATTAALTQKAPLASPIFTGTVTAPTYASTPIPLTYTGSTIFWNPTQGLNAAITLTQNSTLSFTTAPPVGSYGRVVLTQDATGGRTITLPTITNVTNKLLGSTSTSTVALSTAGNSKDILNFYYDGTFVYWNIDQGYGTALASGSTNLATGVNGTLAVANGGTGASTLSGLVKGNGTGAMTAAVAGTDYLAPNGSAANLTNFPTLNQNTTGTAANVTGIVSVANGGTGASTLTGLVKGNGTGAMSAAVAGTDYLAPNGSAANLTNFPTLNQNTTGTAANVAGIVSVVNGGTGLTTTPTNGQIDIGNGTGFTRSTLTAGSGISITNAAGTITIASSGSGSGIPYTVATSAVDFGAYDLTVNGITIGRGTNYDNTNTSLGYNVMKGNNGSGGGLRNTAVGSQAAQYFYSGADNTAVGYNAFNGSPRVYGSRNTAIGSKALSVIGESTSDNTAVGVEALINTTSVRNTSVGYQSGTTNTSGSNNTLIGTQANVGSSNLNNATALGYGAIVSSTNSVRIGNNFVTSIGGVVAWSISSDIRLKKDIVDTKYGLNTVMQFRPVDYTLIGNNLRQVGFIAQEMKKLVPEVVTGIEGDLSKHETLSLTYENLVAVLTKAIQEQQEIINNLQKENSTNTEAIKKLTQQVGELFELLKK